MKRYLNIPNKNAIITLIRERSKNVTTKSVNITLKRNVIKTNQIKTLL